MPTNWKYIKKLLEKEFLCEKLRNVNVNEKVSHGDADIFLDPNAIVTIIHSLTYKDD